MSRAPAGRRLCIINTTIGCTPPSGGPSGPGAKFSGTPPTTLFCIGVPVYLHIQFDLDIHML